MTTLEGDVLKLAKVCLAFGRVDRITKHPDGMLESDTDHTFMLGIVAMALAEYLDTSLNIGLVAQYAYVHDWPEVYAGDTPTLKALTVAQKQQKADREQLAYARLRRQFGYRFPWLVTLLAEYKEQQSREARFVRAVDWMLPKFTHLLNDAQVAREQGMTVDELRARYKLQGEELAAWAGEWPALLELRDRFVELALEKLDDANS
jgi:5'-deoxynucleotidase YfbR-like HD superfamily hydrolase